MELRRKEKVAAVPGSWRYDQSPCLPPTLSTNAPSAACDGIGGDSGVGGGDGGVSLDGASFRHTDVDARTQGGSTLGRGALGTSALSAAHGVTVVGEEVANGVSYVAVHVPSGRYAFGSGWARGAAAAALE